ncbi:MAG: TRAP transporter large permease subunit [Usitatibacter sp.]
METSGLWMLAAVACAMLATGLPSWLVLCGVSLAFAAAGLAAGIFTPVLLAALYPRVVGLVENDLLQALPLYVLMGVLINRLPLADILFRVARHALAFTGRGTPLAGLALGVLLAPMSGSVGASVAMLSRTVHPRMAASGYAEDNNVALVCVASTLGVVIPPSLVLILLGDAMMRAHTEAANAAGLAGRIVNTQDVFHAALVLAAILLALCAAIVALQGPREPRRAAGDAPPVADTITACIAATSIVALLGAVALGRMYAVEAAATGGIALAAYGMATRTLDRAVLAEVLRETIAITGSLFALLVAATLFTLVQRAFGTDRWLAASLAHVPGGPYATLAVVLAALACCALVLDAFEMIFVVIPLVAPALLVRLPDAPWIAVLTLLILQASFLVPPFGYAILMARGRLRSTLGTRELARALTPYVAAQALVVALVIVFPALLWRDAAPAVSATPKSGEALERMLEEQLDAQPAPK